MNVWIGPAAGAALLAGCVQTISEVPQPRFAALQEAQCQMAQSDNRWLGEALRHWNMFARENLRLGNRPPPQITTFDAHCVYSMAAGGRASSRWSEAPHDGQVTLPNGARIAAAPNAFNALGEGDNFVVMSLPSMWQTAGFSSEIGLDVFLEAVMFHELVHSYHSRFLGPSMAFPAIQQRYGLPEGLSDDGVQQHFQGNPAYVRDYEAERDLLFRAAAAPSEAEALNLACEALARLRERRARYFAGSNEKWRIVDELSLTMEGLGQWVSYAWLTGGRGVGPAVAIPRLRGSFWSQDEGLALFLVVDRLVPDWQRLVFGSDSEMAEPLLSRACGR